MKQLRLSLRRFRLWLASLLAPELFLPPREEIVPAPKELSSAPSVCVKVEKCYLNEQGKPQVKLHWIHDTYICLSVQNLSAEERQMFFPGEEIQVAFYKKQIRKPQGKPTLTLVK